MTTEPDTQSSSANSEAESKQQRAEGVRRALAGEEPPQEAQQPTGSNHQSEVGDESQDSAPAGVGESMTRRAEDISEQDGKEAGRTDTGTDGAAADRPTGESTQRDATGVDPQDGATGSTVQGG
jgi:hypothetical protein